VFDSVQGHFSILRSVQTGSGAHSASSLGLKRLGYEADHSPHISIEVKNRWIYISPPPSIRLHGEVKLRKNIIFYNKPSSSLKYADIRWSSR
jgi:hypothetical protein